jgi:hypothetical protein
MTFASEVNSSAAEMLSATQGVGEAVTYHVDGGSDLSINVHIERSEREPSEGDLRASALVTIQDDATLGITAFQAADEITLALRAEGASAARYRIAGVVEKSKAFWRVAVFE